MTESILRHRSAPLVAALGLAVLMSIVAYAGHIPPVVSARGIDKVLHAGMGCALTLAVTRALGGRSLVAGVVVLGCLSVDEYFQRFSASRTSDWNDWLADLVGVAAAIVIARAFARGRRRVA